MTSAPPTAECCVDVGAGLAEGDVQRHLAVSPLLEKLHTARGGAQHRLHVQKELLRIRVCNQIRGGRQK